MRKSFYASQSIYSEPGPYRETLMRGGIEPELIARWISSFMQHPRGTKSEERGFTPEQAADLELRSVAEILAVAVERNLLEGDAPHSPRSAAYAGILLYWRLVDFASAAPRLASVSGLPTIWYLTIGKIIGFANGMTAGVGNGSMWSLRLSGEFLSTPWMCRASGS